MRALRLICLAALVAVLLPGLARAAPQPISAAEYRGRLLKAMEHLRVAQTGVPEAGAQIDLARRQLGDTWEVAAPGGPVTADLRPVQRMLDRIATPRSPAAREILSDSISLVTEHLAALDALTTSTEQEYPNARRHLDEALKQANDQREVNDTLSSWIDGLLRRLFGGGEPSSPRVRSAGTGPSWQTWAALIVGVIGVSLLGWFLLRSLQSNAAGEQVTLRPGRKAARPDRPLTPDELWQLAAEEAAAGDYKEGLRLAHLALLQHLDRAGLLRYLPAQTNREHEWSLRRKHPDLARTMHHLNDLVESRLYSGHGATAEDFRRGESLAQQLWREGDAASKSAQATSGASSSASSS